MEGKLPMAAKRNVMNKRRTAYRRTDSPFRVFRDDRWQRMELRRPDPRRRRVHAVTAEKSDQIASRRCRRSTGCTQPRFDKEARKHHNALGRSFSLATQRRGLAARYDKLAIAYRAAVTISAIPTSSGDAYRRRTSVVARGS